MQRASLQNYCLDDTQWSKAATMAVAFKGKALQANAMAPKALLLHQRALDGFK